MESLLTVSIGLILREEQHFLQIIFPKENIGKENKHYFIAISQEEAEDISKNELLEIVDLRKDHVIYPKYPTI